MCRGWCLTPNELKSLDELEGKGNMEGEMKELKNLPFCINVLLCLYLLSLDIVL